MRLFSLAARPLTGSVFIISGYDVLRNPGPAADLAAPALRRLRDYLPGLPDDDTITVRANAAVQLAAGSMLAFGKAPRLSALVLAASLAPTTYAGHPWWEQEDPVIRSQHKTQFIKNAAILGGLMGVLGDPHGRPSLVWRTKHAFHQCTPRKRSLGKRALGKGSMGKRTLGKRGLDKDVLRMYALLGKTLREYGLDKKALRKHLPHKRGLGKGPLRKPDLSKLTPPQHPLGRRKNPLQRLAPRKHGLHKLGLGKHPLKHPLRKRDLRRNPLQKRAPHKVDLGKLSLGKHPLQKPGLRRNPLQKRAPHKPDLGKPSLGKHPRAPHQPGVGRHPLQKQVTHKNPLHGRPLQKRVPNGCSRRH